MSNVISIATRLPIEEEDALLEEVLVEEAERQQVILADDLSNIRERLDIARNLAENGRLSGMILLGIDPITGLFYTDVNIKSAPREELFAYMGVLQTIITEIQEHAAMAPTIDEHGDISDPYEETAS